MLIRRHGRSSDFGARKPAACRGNFGVPCGRSWSLFPIMDRFLQCPSSLVFGAVPAPLKPLDLPALRFFWLHGLSRNLSFPPAIEFPIQDGCCDRWAPLRRFILFLRRNCLSAPVAILQGRNPSGARGFCCFARGDPPSAGSR